jgi:hypothetical protein
LPYALADRAEDLAAQVVRGVELADDSRGPYVLLITSGDLE